MVFIFKKGDNFLEEFKKKLKEKNITSAFFYGLGGFMEAELSFYDLEKKEYLKKTFSDGPYEVLNATGNVAGDFIHCHATLGDKNYQAIGGHVESATVGGTLELNVVQLEESLQRSPDNDTGLNLL